MLRVAQPSISIRPGVDTQAGKRAGEIPLTIEQYHIPPGDLQVYYQLRSGVKIRLLRDRAYETIWLRRLMDAGVVRKEPAHHRQMEYRYCPYCTDRSKGMYPPFPRQRQPQPAGFKP